MILWVVWSPVSKLLTFNSSVLLKVDRIIVLLKVVCMSQKVHTPGESICVWFLFRRPQQFTFPKQVISGIFKV